VISRKLFVSGLAMTGAAACSSGGAQLVAPKRDPQCDIPLGTGKRRSESVCGGGKAGLGLGSLSVITAANYVGMLMATSAGQSLPAADSHGATVSYSVVPGTSVTFSGYGLSPLMFTSSSAAFSGNPFTIGATTITPIPGYPLTRFSDPTIGSGAVWFDDDGNLDISYTGFGDAVYQVLAGGVGVPTNWNNVPQTQCAQNAATLGAGGFSFGLSGIIIGIAALSQPEITIPALALTAIGWALSGATAVPCPSSSPAPNTTSLLLADTPPALDQGSKSSPPDGQGLADGGSGSSPLFIDWDEA